MVGTIVLTGATGGLASIYAKRVAETHPDDHLVLLVRNPATANVPESPRVHYLALDMRSIAATHEVARTINKKVESEEWPLISALVCSAAIQVKAADQPHRTEDGYEESVAVNHLSHYVLIRDLLGSMQGGRILIVGSEGHRPDYAYFPKPAVYRPLAEQLKTPKEDARDAYPNGMHRYGNSKLDQVMTGHELHRRSLHVLMLDPGSMATGLFRDSSALSRGLLRWVLRRTWLINWMVPGVHAALPEDSAEMMLKLTYGEYNQASLTPNGAPYYFSNGELIESYGAAADEEACAELWRDTAELLGYPVDL